MISKPFLRVRFSLCVILLATVVQGEPPSPEKPAPLPPPPTPLGNATLAPGLKAAAERDRISLLGIAGNEHHAPAAGDALVVWVGASDGKTTRQWLVQLRRSVPTPKEQKSARGRDKTKYLSWGSIVIFKSNVEALELWMAGPVDMSNADAASSLTPAPVKRLRVRVPGDYLRLGLDNSARVNLHMSRLAMIAEREKKPIGLGHIYSLDKPIKPENIAWAKPVADQLGFTPETERAWAGGHVTLQAFYDLANDVPELKEIASIAIARPPLWKLVKVVTGSMFKASLGGHQTRPVDPATIGMMPVALEAFALPYAMLFGDDPMVTGEMIVVSPLPPLDVTGGILGLIASNPRDTRKMVHLVVIGAESGSSKTPPSGQP